MADLSTGLHDIRARHAERERWVEAEPKDVWLALREAQADVLTLLARLGAEEPADDELGCTAPMVVTVGDCDLIANCGECGAPLGSIRADGSLDTLFTNWERHTMTEHTDG